MFKKALLGSTGVIVLSLVVILSGLGRALAAPPGPPTTSVLVAKPPTGPVPVVAQGTTTVQGSVTIGNAATNPVQVRDTDNPARHPFQASFCVVQAGSCPNPSFVVPAGQRLVVEYVSGPCVTGGTVEGFTIGLNTTVGGAGGTQAMHAVASASTAPCGNVFDIAQQLHPYSDGGSTVQGIVMQHEGTAVSVSCQLNLVGSLVSV